MKNAVTLLLAIAFTLALTVTTTSHAQEWTADQREVWAVVADSWNKWASGDIEGSMASFHEKYQGWGDDRPLPVGKAKIANWYNDMKEFMKVGLYDIEPARIVVVANAAVVHYYYEISMTFTVDEKKSIKNMKGKNAEFYVKDGGKWLLLGDLTVHIDSDDSDD